jgi:hypothetical protein
VNRDAISAGRRVLLCAPFVAILCSRCGGRTNTATQPTDDAGDAQVVDADRIDTSVHERWLAFCEAIIGCGLWQIAGSQEMSVCAAAQYEDAAGTDAGAFRSDLIDCVVGSAGDCDTVHRCYAAGSSAACGVDAALALPSCLGNTSTTCNFGSPPWLDVEDCGKSGAHCEPGLGCMFGACSAGADGGEVDSCVGEQVWICRSCSGCPGPRLGRGTNCAFYVATCADGSCVGTGPPCTSVRCDGTVFVQCVSGREAPFDCGSLGLTCIVGSPDAAPPFPSGPLCGLGTECSAYDLSERDACSGSTLTYCDNGRIATRDCTSGGWSRCVDGLGGGRCSH